MMVLKLMINKIAVIIIVMMMNYGDNNDN
jgi:hypothetical protein